MVSLAKAPSIYQLEQRIAQLEREKLDYRQRLEELVEVQDLWVRTMRNKKMSYADKFLYIALVETYPAFLSGTPMQFSVCKVRENAGWIAETPAGNFFSGMQSIGALTYDPGTYDKKANERMGYLTPNPDVFPYPETFDLKSVEKRKKARDEEKKKRQEMAAAWRLFQCEKCGSPNIKYDLIPVCLGCGHRHTPMQDIAGERITIQPIEDTDNLFDDREIATYEAMQEGTELDVLPDLLTPENFNAF